uniref:Uncharacterized protein n=1 Tax=Oryza meridionalis TaxID=40149 RepID=A0A0E0F5Z3_9ORYZ
MTAAEVSITCADRSAEPRRARWRAGGEAAGAGTAAAMVAEAARTSSRSLMGGPEYHGDSAAAAAVSASSSSTSSTMTTTSPPSALSSSLSSIGGSFRAMQIRNLSDFYLHCHSVLDPRTLAVAAATVFSCSDCDEVFVKPDSLDSISIVVSLGQDDTSMNIAEIIFQSSWLKKNAGKVALGLRRRLSLPASPLPSAASNTTTRRRTPRRHGELRVKARAREHEKSRGEAEEEIDGHTCCKLTHTAGLHPGGAKRQAAAGTTVMPRLRARTRGAPASALPGTTTPRRTPDRRGRRARAAQQGKASSRATPLRVGRLRRHSAVVVLLGRRRRRRRPLPPGRLRLRSAFFREREEGSEVRVRWGLRRVDEDAGGRLDKVEELSRHHGIPGSRFSLFAVAWIQFTLSSFIKPLSSIHNGFISTPF